MTRIDRYSLAVVPIEQLFNDESLGIATGFIWKRNGRFYLVTNWHVITCRRFPTGGNLHSQGARPNKLRVFFNLGFQQFGKQEHLITIRDDDARPCWLIHPNRNVDVAVLPLPYDGTDPVFALNPINSSEDPDPFVGVGMDCFGDLTFHDLRGTAVVRLAIAGATVPQIATFTGHSLRDVEAILDAHYLAAMYSLPRQQC
jgi:hypothetical protein